MASLMISSTEGTDLLLDLFPTNSCEWKNQNISLKLKDAKRSSARLERVDGMLLYEKRVEGGSQSTVLPCVYSRGCGHKAITEGKRHHNAIRYTSDILSGKKALRNKENLD